MGGPAFATAVEAVTRSARRPVDGEIALFDDGSVFLADLLREIRGARRSITMTDYIFRDGTMTRSTFAALTERARAGVQVRLLLDWNGSRHAPDDLLDSLRTAGGRVQVFRPLGFRYFTRLHKRTHARAIVVDGRVGYTGGIAFDDGWLGDGTGEEQWRDVMLKVRGSLARTVQDHFNALWRQTDGEILSGPAFYPTDGTSASAADTASSGWYVGLFHSPVSDLSADLQDLVWLSIAGARDHLLLATPYMTPDRDIRNALMAAAQRGVRVEIVMPGPHTDAKLIQAATRAYYDDLLAAGVRIFEYQPGRFHEKTITADGRWSIVGSANLDNRSATLNVENVLALEDSALARSLERELDAVKGRAAEVTAATWRPSPLQRLYFNFARVFAKQY